MSPFDVTGLEYDDAVRTLRDGGVSKISTIMLCPPRGCATGKLRVIRQEVSGVTAILTLAHEMTPGGVSCQ